MHIGEHLAHVRLEPVSVTLGLITLALAWYAAWLAGNAWPLRKAASVAGRLNLAFILASLATVFGYFEVLSGLFSTLEPLSSGVIRLFFDIALVGVPLAVGSLAFAASALSRTEQALTAHGAELEPGAFDRFFDPWDGLRIPRVRLPAWEMFKAGWNLGDLGDLADVPVVGVIFLVIGAIAVALMVFAVGYIALYLTYLAGALSVIAVGRLGLRHARRRLGRAPTNHF